MIIMTFHLYGREINIYTKLFKDELYKSQFLEEINGRNREKAIQLYHKLNKIEKNDWELIGSFTYKQTPEKEFIITSYRRINLENQPGTVV